MGERTCNPPWGWFVPAISRRVRMDWVCVASCVMGFEALMEEKK
jgi:hypothetical protein